MLEHVCALFSDFFFFVVLIFSCFLSFSYAEIVRTLVPLHYIHITMHHLVAFVPFSAGIASSVNTVPLCMTANPANELSRRGFIRTSGILTAGTAAGWFANYNSHSDNCQCGDCGGLHADGCNCGSCTLGEHDLGCLCNNCMMSFRPSSANAYERDVGDNTRSADTYAMNLQVSEYKYYG
jgi:hypothetical protein